MNDKVLQVREACGWALSMLSHNREGCDLLVQSGTAYAIIKAFMDFTQDDRLDEKNGKYLIYLLDALCNYTIYDNGIEPILGTSATACFNKILAKPKITKMGPYT